MTLSRQRSVCQELFSPSLWCCLTLSWENSRSVSLGLLTGTPGECEDCGLKTVFLVSFSMNELEVDYLTHKLLRIFCPSSIIVSLGSSVSSCHSE